MKKILLSLGVLAAALAPLSAQVAAEVALNQEQFLLGEALPVAVRITNRSGQALRLGAEDNWLTFSIESRQGPVVFKNGEAPVRGEFVLESSKVAIKRVDLAPYFSLDQPGHYTIIATVRIRGWEREINSLPKSFDVIEGAKLWEHEFGVPKPGAAGNAEPEVRKYILQQANYLKNQIALYLRLTDASGGKTFRVFPIGRMLSFSRPEAQVDKSSNLHVLYQDGPHSFSYTVVNPAGELVMRQTHDYLNTRPRLQVDAEGTISVLGGVRRVTANDVPSPKPLLPPEAAPAPNPSDDVKPPKP